MTGDAWFVGAPRGERENHDTAPVGPGNTDGVHRDSCRDLGKCRGADGAGTIMGVTKVSAHAMVG